MRSLSRSGSSRCVVPAHWISINATVPWLVRHGVLCAFPASVCVCVCACQWQYVLTVALGVSRAILGVMVGTMLSEGSREPTAAWRHHEDHEGPVLEQGLSHSGRNLRLRPCRRPWRVDFGELASEYGLLGVMLRRSQSMGLGPFANNLLGRAGRFS